MSFFVRLVLLGLIIPGSTNIATSDIPSFLLKTEEYSIVHMYHIYFTHSSADEHLCCFHVLANTNELIYKTKVDSQDIKKEIILTKRKRGIN